MDTNKCLWCCIDICNGCANGCKKYLSVNNE